MDRKFGADSDRLVRHLAALEAARGLLTTRFNEGVETARRVAYALHRLADASGNEAMASAADQLAGAEDADIPRRLAALIEILRLEVDEVSVPRGTILLVEDDLPPARLLAHSLNRRGWNVAIAVSAAEAEDTMASHQISVIVLDLVLPDADGRNLLLRLKEDRRSAGIPVYIASARSDAHVRAECLALGAAGFLPKPVDADQLLQLLAGDGGLNHSAPRERVAKPSGSADRAALVSAFEAAKDSPRVVALIGAAGPGASGPDAIERLGNLLVGSINVESVVARWNADHLAVLFLGDDIASARGSLEGVARELSSSSQGMLGLAAGIVETDPQGNLEDTFNQAGHLLYLAQNSPDLAVVSSVEDIPTPKINVLLAEDDEVAAKLLIYRLTREPGFAVTHCGDGIEALEAARNGHFHLGIFDVNMPGMDGFDLLTRLREMPEYSDVPIVMLTSLGSEKDVVRGLQLGANDYVVKPFSPAELLARVRRLLAGTGTS